MASERKLTVVLAGDSSKLKRELDKASSAVGGFGSKVGSVAKAASLGLAGLGVTGVALGKGFVDAATESLKIGKQTEAVIASMGGAAGVSADHVSQLAENFSIMAGVDDELIQSGENVLLTFGNIRNDIDKGIRTFDEATLAALNMSTALGTDMKSASMSVGKALNDPTKGLAKLTKQGIQFTDEQKNQVKWMQASGDMAGAQAVILGELNRQFGGSAQAQVTAGDRLKVVWGNLQEDLGMKLLPVVEKVANFLANNLPGAIAVAEEWFGRIQSGVSGLVDVFHSEGISGIFERFGALIEEWAPIIGQKLLDLGQKLIDWVEPQVLPLLGKLGEFLGHAVTWILETGLPLLAEGAAKLIPALWEWITDPEDGAIVRLLEALPGFLEAFADWIDEEMLPAAVAGGRKIAESLISGLWDALGDQFKLPAGAELGIPGTDWSWDLPGTKRAGGGPVRRGMPYVVGDGGVPELFVPNENGTILPKVPAWGGASGDTYDIKVYGAGDRAGESVVRELKRQRLLRAG